MIKCFKNCGWENVSADYICLQTKTKFYCCGVVHGSLMPPQKHKLRHEMCLCGMCNESHPLKVEIAREADENEHNCDINKINHPSIPFVGAIPEGLYLARTIDMKGKIPQNSSRFAINLLTEEKQGCDVLFHFNPRFDRRVVVRNHRRKGSWGEEEIAAGQPFPFEPGRSMRLSLFIADGAIMVSVNHRHFCGFPMRMPLELARYLEVEGNVEISCIQYHNTRNYPRLPPSRSPRVLLPARRHDTSLVIQRKTKMIEPGCIIKITGRVKLLPQHFFINLQVGSTIVPHPIIPLHINLRLCRPGLQEQQMIYNSWVNGCWGTEVKPADCPFFPGMVFTLEVLYLEEGFHVSVNGNFLIAFPLRLPYPPILDTILVEGDVIVTKVKVSTTALRSAKEKLCQGQ